MPLIACARDGASSQRLRWRAPHAPTPCVASPPRARRSPWHATAVAGGGRGRGEGETSQHAPPGQPKAHIPTLPLFRAQPPQ
eukprot:360121-Chlamydomonas_euryale.AAC.5